MRVDARILNKVTVDDLSGDMKEIAGIIGIKMTLALAKHFRGQNVYFKKLSTATRKLRDRNIYADFQSGLSYKEIAKKYGLTSVWVREVVKRFKAEKRTAHHGSGAITLNDLDGDVKTVAGVIGLSKTIKLIAKFSGQDLYISLPEKALAGLVKKAIVAEHRRGATVRQLALKYDYTETWVRAIIKEGKSNEG